MSDTNLFSDAAIAAAITATSSASSVASICSASAGIAAGAGASAGFSFFAEPIVTLIILITAHRIMRIKNVIPSPMHIVTVAPANPLEAVSVGDIVDVQVLAVDMAKKRISLTMKIKQPK